MVVEGEKGEGGIGKVDRCMIIFVLIIKKVYHQQTVVHNKQIFAGGAVVAKPVAA